MKIAVMKYGEALYNENRIFIDVKTDNMIPMSFCFYLIQTEDKNILVDVGCDGVERYKMYAFIHPVELLKEYGLEPDDITDIIITHAHFDHIEAVNFYKNAVIHIQEDEYEMGKDYIKGENKINTFGEELLFDEEIRVVKYAGHSKGSCIVFADNNLLCGDECYFNRNFEDEVRIGNSCNPEKSTQFVKEYKNSDYNTLLFHDSSILTGKTGFEIVYEKEGKRA